VRIIAFIRRFVCLVRNEIGRLAMSAVFLRSRPGSVSLHPRLLPDGATSLSASGMRRRIRRGAGVLRNTARCDCRLLLRGVSRQKTRQPGTACRRPAGCERFHRINQILIARNARTPRISANAADAAKFLQLPLSRVVKNSVKKFLNPDRDPDQHQNRMICC